MGPTNLDLNLLVALDALLQECSVTRAAERLGLSQPTLSASLARLRRHFDDQLLYRSGNSYHLTPLALNLASRTPSALDEVGRIFASQGSFDPATSTREFVFVCSDYTAAVVGSKLSATVTRHAPNTRVHLRQSDASRYVADEDRLRTVDGVFLPHGFLHGVPHVDLFEDRWVCLVSADNESVGEHLSMQDLSRLPWVVTSHGGTYTTTAVRQLAQLGVQISVQASVENFLVASFMVAGTDRVALVQRRVVDLFGELPGVRVLECPHELDPLVEALWWHPDFERDAEHAWLREQLSTVAADLGAIDSADPRHRQSVIPR